MSRARSRFAALAAALPLLVVGGPIVSAGAEDGPVTQATMVTTLGDYRVGPRAGFRGDVDRGVNGSTAIMKVATSPSAVVNTVVVRVTMDRAFSVYQHFNSNDGFGLYKDANDNGRLDVAEYDAGTVTTGYTVTGDAGAAVITMGTDPARATGSSTYLLTVHPAVNSVADRNVTFTVPTGGISTSAGSLPASPFVLDDIVIDSLAPTLIALENFTPVSRYPLAYCPPGAAVGTCGNDGYRVHRGWAPAEAGAKIGFFNATGDVSDAALLIATPATQSASAVPAIYDISAIPANEEDKVELSIGNGTGRDAAVVGSKALNNQLSDTVYVAQWDQMGNFASQAPLTNDSPCVEGSAGPPPCVPPTPRGNDVTGVRVTSHTVSTFNNVNTDTVNPAAVSVKARMNGLDSARATNRLQSSVGMVRSVAVLHRLSDQLTSLFQGPQAWSPPKLPASFSTVSDGDLESFVDASSDDNFPSPSRIRGTFVLVDQVGNPNTAINSLQKWRDRVAPRLVSAALLDENQNGQPDEGERYRIVFDDALDTTKVTSANVNDTLDADSIPGAPFCSSQNPDPNPPNQCPYWGDAPGVSWTADGRTLTITLGAPDCTDQPAPTTNPHPPAPLCRLARAGDEIQVKTTVIDLGGNKVANTPFIIQNPYVQELGAKTIDVDDTVLPPVYGTGRDGVLEAIDITFSGPVTKTSIADAAAQNQFSIEVPGGSKLTPTSVVGQGGGSTATVVRLAFTVPVNEAALWGTSATPLVKFTGGGTMKSGTQFILPFPIVAADGAAPVPVSMTTSDTTGNGKIDRVFVKFSEAVNVTTMNECGYTVTGYANPAYVPPSANPAPPANVCPTAARNAFAAVTGQPDTVALTLVEGANFDTQATPTLSYSATNQVPSYGPGTGENGTSADDCNPNASLALASTPNCAVTDMVPADEPEDRNNLFAFSGTATDGAMAAIVSRATADNDSDGHLDALNVTFSEGVDTPSVGAAQFVLTEPAYTIDKIEQAADALVRIRIVPGVDPAGDTAVKPKLQYLGGITDASDPSNATTADAAGVVVTDKAGPAIMAACVSMTIPAATTPAEKTAQLGKCPEGAGDKMAVLFSEPLDTTANVFIPADFVVEQNGVTRPTTDVASVAVSGSTATLTMAASKNLDNTKDAYVKLSAAGVVNDNATAPKNANTQSALIGAWTAPTVTLDITCPVAATPDHCSADYVNTGANGSSAVSSWRLVESAVAPAMPAAGDFTTATPSRWPAEGIITEGEHKLWLRGKDALDRMSPEVNDSVTVYKTPKLLNVQMVNSTPRKSGTWSKSSTVMDGDSILLGGDAYGTDAAQWAANSAPTGGGCLAQHMSVDVRSLSGRSTDGAVRPTKCDLKTTTEQPYRQMQFPVVRAAGTTKYPVGTVLKVTDTDPGSLLVDGPGGTLRRRQFISVGARRSWMISDASVIKVPTTLVNAIPKTTSMKYRNGALLRTSTGYYYVYEGLKRPVSAAQLSAWRMSTSTAYRPTSGELKLIPTGSRITGSAHAAGTWIKYSDGRIYQVVRNKNGVAVRRKLASSSALRTLVPTSQIYPANSSDSKLAIDTWLRGYRDGTLLRLSDGTYGVIARGSLRKFANPATFNTLGYATSNAISPNGAAMPRVSGQAYRVGETIDRYKFSTVVMKVTNKAGGVDSEIVLPSLGGIYGVGTIDPVPLGWDTTR